MHFGQRDCARVYSFLLPSNHINNAGGWMMVGITITKGTFVKLNIFQSDEQENIGDVIEI